MLLAFDDTDSPTGGCTTHALFAVLQALPGLAPAGLPRLVRLNPNAPWKTRGNGAVCIELVKATGPAVRIGEWRGMEIRANPRGDPATSGDVNLDAIWQVLQGIAQPDASPALVVMDRPPSEAFYWQAVQTLVEPDAVAAAFDAAQYRFGGSNRGLVGAVAAAAWRGPASSLEFIAYRTPERIGTPRDVDDAPLRPLDARGHTFHTVDPEADRLACVPNTPCPVLLGLRGRDPDKLLDAAMWATHAAAKEPVDAWLLWDSNQASGDHVLDAATTLDAPPGSTIRIQATVTDAPITEPGGHVHLPLADTHGIPFTGIAFEPTGSFREAVRSLLPGDAVIATGAWKDTSLQLESFVLREAISKKVANPEHCGKSMKSRGSGAGYKCVCGATADESEATFEARPTGAFEAPVMARRHLHRPLAW